MAFYNCTSLTNINIPNSVINIGEYAFFGCKSLKTVNYSGTTEQFKKISSGESPFINVSESFRIICKDGILDKELNFIVA